MLNKDYNDARTYYFGDGISDITAAQKCKYLFAKADMDLMKWCEKEKKEYFKWYTFNDIQKKIKEIRSEP